ncbi:MAG TPA: bifunctional hydroxymethylpyrimidine kinase/phosphomethylpyrimidine kinase [Actinomycetota bacterium]|nr:bifunctional hydroxymethylpyrimidine kinase/phosphomethylpyrimidine kinase [Actinomycetota bacterium]
MGSPELTTEIPIALTIAGSDSGGGAGIQADLKTFLALGVHGTSAIVALTAQNTTGVSAIHPVPPSFVREQISQVVTDMGVDAAKTGMLGSSEMVSAVADAVVEFQIAKLVVDPVFVSKNQDVLLEEDAVGALVNKLFPLALVITPNLYEAGSLLGREIRDLADMKDAAKALHEMGPRFVLVKGGHLHGDAVDVLYDGTNLIEYSSERIDSPHAHGTGCTLSAAITAYIAKGDTVPEAVEGAKRYIEGAIRHGLAIGKGHGPTNHRWRGLA